MIKLEKGDDQNDHVRECCKNYLDFSVSTTSIYNSNSTVTQFQIENILLLITL